MNSWRSRLQSRLDARRRAQLERVRLTVDSAQQRWLQCDQTRLINFSSNDYLSLAAHGALAEALKNAVDTYGVGAGASHLVSGHMRPHAELEHKLAEFTGAEAALVFSSGYMANLSILTVLANRGDTILADRLNHASLVDGAILSRARHKRYRHNDVAHARRLLNPEAGNVIVSDSVFSMDGDIAPVRALEALANDTHSALVLDDAHGLGVLGDGRGIRQVEGLGSDVIVVGTFGKALGVHGAFVSGPRLVIDALVQFARPYIYTTAMPPALAAAVICAMQIVEKEPWRRDKLLENIQYFRARAESLGIRLMPSDTPIQPLLLNTPEVAMEVSAALRQAGFLVTAIRPPTVPAGTSRLRIVLNAGHERAEINALLVAVHEALPTAGMSLAG